MRQRRDHRRRVRQVKESLVKCFFGWFLLLGTTNQVMLSCSEKILFLQFWFSSTSIIASSLLYLLLSKFSWRCNYQESINWWVKWTHFIKLVWLVLMVVISSCVCCIIFDTVYKNGELTWPHIEDYIV